MPRSVDVLFFSSASHVWQILFHRRKENGGRGKWQLMESPPHLDASTLAQLPLHLFWLPPPQESPSRCSKTRSEPGQPCQCLHANDSTAIPSNYRDQTYPDFLMMCYTVCVCLHCTKVMVNLRSSHNAFSGRWSCTTYWRAQHSYLKAYAIDGCTSETAGNRNSRSTPHHPLG